MVQIRLGFAVDNTEYDAFENKDLIVFICFLLCVDGTDTVRFEFAVDNTEYWYDAFEFS